MDTQPIWANPVTPLESRASWIGFCLAFIVEILLMLVFLYRFDISIWRTTPVLLLMNIPIWLTLRIFMDRYIGAELERWWKHLPYPNTFYPDEVKSIVSAELLIMVVEGILLFLFMKWSWLRTYSSRSLSLLNSFGVSMIANTVSALIPSLVDHSMGVSTFNYVVKYLLSP